MSEQKKPSIEIEHFSFYYPEQAEKTLDDLTLTVERGEFLVLCGPSGCGKSTLLRQLKTVLAPHGRRMVGVSYPRLSKPKASSCHTLSVTIWFSGLCCTKPILALCSR